MKSLKQILTLILIILLLLGGAYFYFSWNPSPILQSENRLMVERIESMGKLELVKVHIKDIIDVHEKVANKFFAFLPESSAAIIVVGEASGGIDLSKIKPEDIQITQNKVIVRLPAPEIIYFKVDHQQSKVYDVKRHFWTKAELVDEAYKIAEVRIRDEALTMGILDQTQENAQKILKPLLASMTRKEVELVF